MNKKGKVILIVLAVLAVAAAAGGKILQSRPAAPADYQKTVATGGTLEAKYLADGAYEVERYQEKTMQEFSPYTIYYPGELAQFSQSWPVIVLDNGTGVPLSKYPAVARHYASWGFIVIGTEEEYSWSGFGAEMCVRHLQRLNERETIEDQANVFCGKIDLDKIGIVGHSQGGVGVINAITVQPHHDRYQAAVVLSPTNMELAASLEWDYDPSGVSIPILLMAGAGGGDDWVVTGEQLKQIYDRIPSDKVMLRRSGTAHAEMLYAADGYVTAWFMALLKGDQEAAAAFSGKAPEILSNPLYQDQAVGIGH
jgi:dienelactone hydrolase